MKEFIYRHQMLVFLFLISHVGALLGLRAARKERAAKMALESNLQSLLLMRAPEWFPNLRLFRRNVGEAKMRGGHTVQFGIAGQCDLYAIARGGKLHVEIELKNVGKKIAKGSEQDVWRSWCAEWNIPHIVLTAAKDETDQQTVQRWCVELGELLEREAAKTPASPPLAPVRLP